MQQQFWHSVSSPLKMEEQAQAPVGCVLNGFCKGGSGIFGFRLVWRCLSAALYFVSNQSLRLQENSPAGTQRRISLKENLMKCKRKGWNRNPTLNHTLSLGCWLQTLVDFLFKWFPLGCDMDVLSKDVTSVTTLLPLPTKWLKKKEKREPNIYNHSTRNRWFRLSVLQKNAWFEGMLLQ